MYREELQVMEEMVWDFSPIASSADLNLGFNQTRTFKNWSAQELWDLDQKGCKDEDMKPFEASRIRNIRESVGLQYNSPHWLRRSLRSHPGHVPPSKISMVRPPKYSRHCHLYHPGHRPWKGGHLTYIPNRCTLYVTVNNRQTQVSLRWFYSHIII